MEDGLGRRELPEVSPGLFPTICRGRISLSEGVRKMTTMAAERLNLPCKGNLMQGSDADIVIFDMKRVKDKATYEDGPRSRLRDLSGFS